MILSGGTAMSPGARTPGFGDFLLGTGKNIISRVVDMEFPTEHTFNDPTALGKAESSGAVFVAGQPTGANVAGFNVSPVALWVGAFLAISLFVVLAARK
jgi:hypothetical protein